jgi:hypothetical protein
MISETVGKMIMGDLDKETGLSRVTCNTVASMQMFCKCGSVLDQKTVRVVTAKTPIRRVVRGFCQNCWDLSGPDIIDAAETTGTDCLVECWDGIVFKQGEV